ncbi:hypothetical protein MWU49_01350 [Alcanivorax sp. S6407]|uniref:PA1571 family protein n=1 Tax=Alcanivorax sp. S6407 TaxID=2926424 RepID=UPI001FF232B0|nr:PA1571 family protein [Alcanivorax sp. S6407]MCK0152337.1 hypothetical protein [Alcanivorax sp. S6407]
MNVHSQQQHPQFNGGAIIDDQGREVPITEAMIQHACENLARDWSYPLPRKAKATPEQKAR